ncbi:hypothetical protein Pfo_025325 [Paulownia fortunei]|nr:hypothetical protein Pfo_025325 [Paulownia fortunei]
MFFLRPINWASLLFLGLAFWLYYRYPGAKDMAAESPKSIYEFTVKAMLLLNMQPTNLRAFHNFENSAEFVPLEAESEVIILSAICSSTDIRGNDVSLSNYRGKVLLIVNVASKCGLTHSNYKELNILYEKYKDQGFEILAFPCNQFASQEPGTNEEIQEAVCTRFKAEFPIFDKIKVNGKNAAPLYMFLKSEKGGLFVDAIKWNFTKFLVNKDGKVVERYGPTTPPLAIEKDVQNLLAK